MSVPRPPEQFSILFVCTGNICRSPFAEVFARHLLEQRGASGWCTVSSAGTDAVVGATMHPVSRAQLAGWGVPDAAADPFVARQVDRELVSCADLVLGATPAHRGAVVRLFPGALATAFSVLEFARLAAQVDLGALPVDPAGRARTLVIAARARRGMIPPGAPGSDEIPDPIDGAGPAHARAADLSARAVTQIVDLLIPSAPIVPGPRSEQEPAQR